MFGVNINGLTSRQQIYQFKADLNLNLNDWETDDPYDKNPITAYGYNITWYWRYECDGGDGGDGGNGDDSDVGADKNTMVTMRSNLGKTLATAAAHNVLIQ